MADSGESRLEIHDGAHSALLLYSHPQVNDCTPAAFCQVDAGLHIFIASAAVNQFPKTNFHSCFCILTSIW